MKSRTVIIVLAILVAFVACKKREGVPSASAACAPQIVQHPANTTVSPGQGAELTVVANGEGPFRYDWYEAVPGNSKLIPGNSSKITVTPQKTTGYFVWVYNRCGGKISNLVTVKVQ